MPEVCLLVLDFVVGFGPLDSETLFSMRLLWRAVVLYLAILCPATVPSSRRFLLYVVVFLGGARFPFFSACPYFYVKDFFSPLMLFLKWFVPSFWFCVLQVLFRYAGPWPFGRLRRFFMRALAIR